MKIKSNVGSGDKIIRLLVAILLIILFYLGKLNDISGVIALIVALLLTVSSLVSFCPLYKPLRINTVFRKDIEKDKKGK